jgi:hypothetical protein
MSTSSSAGRLPRDCRPGCVFTGSCSGEGLSHCPMQMRSAMFADFIYSAFIHAVVLFFLLTVPIYGGSVHLKPYGFLSVSLRDEEGGKAAEGLKTASNVSGRHVEKAGLNADMTTGRRTRPAEERASRHHDMKQEMGQKEHAGKKVTEELSPSPVRDTETKGAPDVYEPRESHVAAGKKPLEENEIYAGGSVKFPLLAADAESEEVLGPVVPDLFEIPQAVTAEKTGPDDLSRQESSDDEAMSEKVGAPDDNSHEQLSGGRPPSQVQAEPSRPVASEDNKSAVKTEPPGEEIPPANSDSTPGSIAHKSATRAAEKRSEAESTVPDLIGAPDIAPVPKEGEPNAMHAMETPEDKAASGKAFVSDDSSPVLSPGLPPVPQDLTEQSADIAAEEDGDAVSEALTGLPAKDTGLPEEGVIKDSLPAEPAPEKNASASAPVPPLPESAFAAVSPPSETPPVMVMDEDQETQTSAVAGEAGLEEEIRSAVTRIGEITYDSPRVVAKAGGEKEEPKAAVGSGHKSADAQSAVPDIPPPVSPDMEPDATPGKGSVEEEIRSAVTRIGETTYGPPPVVAGAGEEKEEPKVAAEESGGSSPSPQRVVLTVPLPAPPAIIPDSAAGDLWTEDRFNESGSGMPVLRTDAEIEGHEFPSGRKAGKDTRAQEIVSEGAKRDRAEAVPGFPLPEAFFVKDIRIEVSMKSVEMPDIPVKLLNRPLTAGTRRKDPKNHEVAVKDETGNITVGGRVSTEKMFSVAKAGKGIYTFFMENKGERPCEADVNFVLYGGDKGGRIKTYEGLRILPGSALTFRFLLPQAIFWDDADAFTGSIESSDSITKFNYDTGLVWKEEKDY